MTNTNMAAKGVGFAFLLASSSVFAWEETCTQFKNIYTDGTELCEKMWADSFQVVDDSQPGYTMWFFDQNSNPNDAVTKQLFGQDAVPDQCHLQYFHKESPGAEDDSMTECHPWKNNACCDSTTVKSVDALNEGYGEGYRWDRCGPMSQACERFFVMEACLYECEPSAGLFRKYNDSLKDSEEYNEWQMHKMPIKKSFCDSWYTACANDYFCGSGDYFECAAYYYEKEKNESSSTSYYVEESSSDNKGLIIGLSVVGCLAFLGLVFIAYLIHKEKSGNPVFEQVEPLEGGVET